MNPNNREFHNLEPYTLEWWMYLEGRAREEKEVANNLYQAETYEFGYKRKDLLKGHDRNWDKYNNLVAYIRSRIVQKYGEQSQGPVSLKRIVIGLIEELQKDKEKTCQVCGDLETAGWKECGCHVEGINEGLTIAISKLQKAL